MQDNYPRDMVGYGSQRIDPVWPSNAKIAVQFVVNYEEGAENSILHGDRASEAFLSEIVGAAPIEGVRHMNMEVGAGSGAYTNCSATENYPSLYSELPWHWRGTSKL